MQFTYKGISVEVPEGRLEVCRLKDKFDDFAAGMRDEVMNSFDENFADMRAFLAGCDEWAHGFIDRGADMVIRELAALDCYDMDREEWIAKHIDYSTWDASTKPYRKMVAELDAEEAEKEVKRAARTEDWGNTYSEHKVTIHSDDDGNAEVRDNLDGGNIVANLGLSAASGLFNMIGRGMSKSKIERQLKEAFESTEFRTGVESGILDSIANAYVAFIDYCMKNGVKTDYVPFTKDELDKSNRLINNIERGIIPAEKLDAMIANALVASPHNERIYMMLLLNGEDKDGTLTKIAEFFHFRKLNSIKKAAFLKECGDPTVTMDKNLANELKELGEVVITNEEELAAYKEKYAKVAHTVQLPDAELSQLIAKLEREYAAAIEEERQRKEKEEREAKEWEELKTKTKGGVKVYLCFPLWVLEKIAGEKDPLATLEVEGEVSEKKQLAICESLTASMQDAGYSATQREQGEIALSNDSPNSSFVHRLHQFQGSIAIKPSPSGKGYKLELTGKTSYSLLLGITSWILAIPPFLGYISIILYFFVLRPRATKAFMRAVKKLK